MTNYKRLLSYLTPYKLAILLAVVGFALNAATEAGIGYLMKYIIDAIAEGNRTHMNWFPALIIGFFILRGLAGFLGNYYSALISRNMVYELRVQAFNKILRLPSAFFLNNSTGSITAKLIYDVEQVSAASIDALKTILRDGLVVIALMGNLLYLNWRLTLILFAIMPLVALLVRYASKRFRKLSHRIQAAMGEVSHVSSEVVGGIDVVKNFGGQAVEGQRFDAASKNNLRQAIKVVVTESINTPLIQLVLAVGMSVVVYLALRPEILGNTTPGEFVQYIGLAALLSKPVKALTGVNAAIQRGLAGAESIFTLLDMPDEKDSSSLGVQLTGDVTFEHVALTYEDGTQALRDFNLHIEAGQTVAFVGRSGAGKTSLINLLSRTYTASCGRILLDGKNINDMQLASLRSQIASVSQKVTLFATSVHDNIAYGALKNATRQEVTEAAKAAFAHEFIETLPQGYDTMLGSGGNSLSGGQRQRIAIARALLKDAPILILDEATSALDNESEHYIQQALERAMQSTQHKRTTLVIAHRLSTVENADKIVVMDKGQIVEQGTHTELLKKNGLYASMHARDFDADQ